MDKNSTRYKGRKIVCSILAFFLQVLVISFFFSERGAFLSNPLLHISSSFISVTIGFGVVKYISSFFLLLPLLSFKVSKAIATYSKKIYLQWILGISPVLLFLYSTFEETSFQAGYDFMSDSKNILCFAAAISIIITFCQLIHFSDERIHEIRSFLLTITPLIFILWCVIEISPPLPSGNSYHCYE